MSDPTCRKQRELRTPVGWMLTTDLRDQLGLSERGMLKRRRRLGIPDFPHPCDQRRRLIRFSDVERLVSLEGA